MITSVVTRRYPRMGLVKYFTSIYYSKDDALGATHEIMAPAMAWKTALGHIRSDSLDQTQTQKIWHVLRRILQYCDGNIIVLAGLSAATWNICLFPTEISPYFCIKYP